MVSVTWRLDRKTVDTVEVGVKTEFADGRARFNAAVFYSDYKDQQINQFINGAFSVVNVDSEIYGGEAELSWLPAEGLYVNASIGLLDTEITASNNPAQIGNQLVNSPDFTAQLSVRREWDLASGSRFGLSGDGRLRVGAIF